MVKKISIIGNKTNTVNIFPEGSVPLSGMHKHKHAEGCQCEVCELVGKDEKTVEFIKKARKKFKNKFNYSYTIFKNQKTNIKIKCPIHGEFEQTPRNHIKSEFGCKQCKKDNLIGDLNRFIDNGNKNHKNKYIYSKSVFKGNKTDLIIICPIHGEFKQKPYYHINLKKGCKKCANQKSTDNKKIKSEKEFFIEAPKIHNNKYDYSAAKYLDRNKKLKIICPIHGAFTQTPYCHTTLRQGCYECGLIKRANSKKRGLDKFVVVANKIHNNKYSYAKSIYIDGDSEIEIICPIHGSFWQVTDSHLSKSPIHGCKKCGIESRVNKRRGNLDELIKKSREKHGNKYDFKYAIYKNNHTNLIIICPIHGKFKQTPTNHISSHGCKKCGIEDGSKKRRDSLEEFIIKSRNKHGNKYDYSLVKLNKSKKVTIICPKHGKFVQNEGNHKAGAGCRRCNDSKGEIYICKHLFSIHEKYKREKMFKGCINPISKRRLEFDFYVKKYNLCIEFDGEQHYNSWLGKLKEKYKRDLEYTKFKDSVKNKFCSKNHINLLRISYKDFYKISEIINAAIEKIKKSKTGYVKRLY